MDLFLSGAWAEEAAETAEAAAEAVTETAAEPGYFAQLTEGIEDTESACLLAPSADTPNPTKLSMWYLDGDNSFKKV